MSWILAITDLFESYGEFQSNWTTQGNHSDLLIIGGIGSRMVRLSLHALCRQRKRRAALPPRRGQIRPEHHPNPVRVTLIVRRQLRQLRRRHRLPVLPGSCPLRSPDNEKAVGGSVPEAVCEG